MEREREKEAPRANWKKIWFPIANQKVLQILLQKITCIPAENTSVVITREKGLTLYCGAIDDVLLCQLLQQQVKF